jgi:Ca-activated chloride channel family protein
MWQATDMKPLMETFYGLHQNFGVDIQVILILNSYVPNRHQPTLELSEEAFGGLMIIRSSLFPLALLLLSICFLLSAAVAQAGDTNHAPTFAVDAPVVLVPTTVMDRKGAIVSGLPPDAFQVTQDNVPQKITSFGEQDVPVSVGIVFDTSGSMRSVLPQAKSVIKAFLDACNPDDEAFLYTVSNRPEQDAGFTSDFDSLREPMVLTNAGGSTALVDTIYAAMLQSRSARHLRKALLVISDGMDNHSRYSAHELIAAAVEADVQIYSVSLYDPPRNQKPIELQKERNGIFFLEDLTRRTGGLQIMAHDSSDINKAAAGIGRAMRDEYLIGFVPENADANGKWHSIKVNLKAGNAKAYARSGFYSK